MSVIIPPDIAKKMIKEVNMQEMLQLTEEVYKVKQGEEHFMYIDGYNINVGSPKYRMFVRDKRCVCCGILGTKMYICETDDGTHTLNIFAETKKSPNAHLHLTLMTQDHILEKRKGGSDELSNIRCMCLLCNNLRDITDLPIELMQSVIKLAGRIRLGSGVIYRTREKLEKQLARHKKLEHMLLHLGENLDKIKVDKEAILAKYEKGKADFEKLDAELLEIERQSQVSGIVYNEK